MPKNALRDVVDTAKSKGMPWIKKQMGYAKHMRNSDVMYALVLRLAHDELSTETPTQLKMFNENGGVNV